MKPLLRVILLLAVLALPRFASAGSLSLSGDTTGAPTFNRPTDTGAPSAFTVPYQAYLFTVSQDGPYNFTLTATDPSLYDTFLHLYVGSFNPSAPSQGFFRANDDRGPDATLGSALTGVSLSAASTYYLVADGYLASDYGAFTAGINGPGSISASAVPEPSALLLLVGGALGTAWQRRTPGGYAWVLAVSALLGMPLAAAAFLVHGAFAAQACLAGSMLALFLLTGPINTLILETVPVALRASAMAVTIFVIHLFGDLGSPWLVGKVSDLLGGDLRRAILILPAMLAVSAGLWTWLAVRQQANGRKRQAATAG